MVFYNDIDPFCCAWLESLIIERLIPWGKVVCCPIQRITDDLSTYSQVHLFAGIGGWAYALRLAGWPEDRPVWTGSCPCQPFSVAGKRQGTKDKRHLWPFMRKLIKQYHPPEVFGEQVASKSGREWLSRVRTDLERMAYETGCADLCSAGVSAPNIRQRLWWVAQSVSKGPLGLGEPQCNAAESGRIADESREGVGEKGTGTSIELGRSSSVSRLDNPTDSRCSGDRFSRPSSPPRYQARLQESSGRSSSGRLVLANGQRLSERKQTTETLGHRNTTLSTSSINFWSNFTIIPCLDSKSRRIESGTFPLAHGIPNRMGRLRGYGNAINPQLAAVFIRSYMEACEDLSA